MENFTQTLNTTGWRKLFFCFLFLSILFATTNSKAQYCIPTYAYGACDEFISNVSIGTINYGSVCDGIVPIQYHDYTSTFTDLFAGLSYPITVTIGPPFYGFDQITVYADWNQDLDFFDAGESYILTNNGGGNFTGNVDVPLTATLGISRLRVMMTYNVAPEPCNANGSTYGETEDYTINVQPGPTCPFSTQLNVTNTTTTTADLNWTGNLSASYYKVRYKKTIDPTSVSTWANPTIVTAPTVTLAVSGLVAATQYEFQVSTFCSASDSSGYPLSSYWSTGCFDCPANSIPEAEACGSDVNGGCNMPIPFFEQINCGDTICGTAWAEVNANFPFGGRDTDWYTFDVTVPGVYTIFAKAMFPAQMGYIGPNAACPITAFTDYVTTPNECDSLSLTGYLTVGTWIYFISPSVFDGYSCGSGHNNYLTYVCSPTPPLVVANDACDGAQLITQNPTCVPTTGDVAGAFIQTGAACFGTAEDDVWFKFVATTPNVVIQVTGSAGFYPVAEVYDACPGTQLGCIPGTGTGGIATQTFAPFNVGQTYYIRVYDAFATVPSTTTFDICVFDAPSGPANDLCADAIPVICGDIVTGTTISATSDLNASTCGTNPSAPGVWYVIAGDGSVITASLCNGTFFDTKINVYSGDCSTLTCVNGNDDFCGTQSQVSFPTVLGTNYYILVNGYNVATGDFQLDISCLAPPPNDQPCGAIALALGINGPYDNTFATTDSNDPPVPGTDCQANNSWCPFGGNLPENTLWFTFTAPASGRIIIQSPDFDTELAIWDATDCNSLASSTMIAANDDDPNYAANGSTIFSSYVYADCLTPGNTYYVELDGYSGTVGSTNIVLTNPGSIDASFATLNSRYCPASSAVTLVPVTVGGIFSGPGIIGNTFNPAIAGIGGPYNIVYTVLGCITDTVSTTVEYPLADISPNGPVTVCYGQAVPLTTPFDAGYTYKWKRGPFTIPGATTNSFTPIWSGTFKYSVKVTDVIGGGCFAKDSVYYTMINFQNPTLIVGPCINNTILLSSSVTNPNLNYQWVKGVTPINGATNTSYLVTLSGAYRVAMTDSCGTLKFTPLVYFNVNTCRAEEMSDEQVAQMVDVVLYPNPNEGQFTIDLSSYDLSSSEVRVDVYNVLGQVVYSKNLTLSEGKLNNLIQLPSTIEDGLYNVRIKKGNYETYTKIVVSK